MNSLSHGCRRASSLGEGAFGKTENLSSSPEALPLGELARQRLRGRAIYNFKKQEHYT